jgi:hypothetical protein
VKARIEHSSYNLQKAGQDQRRQIRNKNVSTFTDLL